MIDRQNTVQQVVVIQSAIRAYFQRAKARRERFSAIVIQRHVHEHNEEIGEMVRFVSVSAI